MNRLLKLRFLDIVTDAENPTFVTAFMDGHLRGYIKREPKYVVSSSADGTSCRPQKDRVTEARAVLGRWHQIDRRQFEGLLGEFNTYRTSLGWDPIELPHEEVETDGRE